MPRLTAHEDPGIPPVVKGDSDMQKHTTTLVRSTDGNVTTTCECGWAGLTRSLYHDETASELDVERSAHIRMAEDTEGLALLEAM